MWASRLSASYLTTLTAGHRHGLPQRLHTVPLLADLLTSASHHSPSTHTVPRVSPRRGHRIGGAICLAIIEPGHVIAAAGRPERTPIRCAGYVSGAGFHRRLAVGQKLAISAVLGFSGDSALPPPYSASHSVGFRHVRGRTLTAVKPSCPWGLSNLAYRLSRPMPCPWLPAVSRSHAEKSSIAYARAATPTPHGVSLESHQLIRELCVAGLSPARPLSTPQRISPCTVRSGAPPEGPLCPAHTGPPVFAGIHGQPLGS